MNGGVLSLPFFQLPTLLPVFTCTYKEEHTRSSHYTSTCLYVCLCVCVCKCICLSVCGVPGKMPISAFQLTQAGIEGVETATRLTTHTFSSFLLLPTFLCYFIFFLCPLHPPPVLSNYCLSFLPVSNLPLLWLSSPPFLSDLPHHPYSVYVVALSSLLCLFLGYGIDGSDKAAHMNTYWTVSVRHYRCRTWISLFCFNLRRGAFVIVVCNCFH